MKKFFLTFFMIGVFLGAVVAVAEVAQKENLPHKMIRVAIVRDARELNLSIDGPYHFIDMESDKVIGTGRRIIKARVRLLDKGIFMGVDVYPTKRLVIKP